MLKKKRRKEVVLDGQTIAILEIQAKQEGRKTIFNFEASLGELNPQ